MDIFASIRQLLTITTSTDDRYSTVVYPTRGEAVLIHDGLGIANEYPWYHRLITQPNSSSNEINDCDWSKRNELDEDAFWGTGKCEDDSYWDYESEGSEINPASGLPMLGGVDVAGNPYGSGSFFQTRSRLAHQASKEGWRFRIRMLIRVLTPAPSWPPKGVQNYIYAKMPQKPAASVCN